MRALTVKVAEHKIERNNKLITRAKGIQENTTWNSQAQKGEQMYTRGTVV
jgi:hypothetical protein